jgi:signal transduction histidine kinase
VIALRAGRFRTLRLAFAASVHQETTARAGSLLFVTAGVLGLLALAFPGGTGSSAAAGAATSVCACALGAALWLWGTRLSAPAYQPFGIAATALASVSTYFGGAEGWLNGFFFLWIALFIAYFFTLAAVVLQTVLIAAAYASALALNDAIQHGALIWFLTVTTVAVTAAIVAVLRSRLERALEAEHRQVEHLLELDRLKDDFIATVSHELRTPVSAVYGAAETLIARDLPERRRTELLRIAHLQALRLVELVDSLLTSASLDRGLLSVDLRPIDPVVPVLDAVEALRARASSRTVNFDAPAQLHAVMADPSRLHQALAAVLDNAAKYSPAQAPIDVRLTREGGHIRISISDHGPGIPETERERVFDKFHRLDPDMTNGIGGSGLGLHIARALIAAMAGDAWIEATHSDGSGTKVILQLPFTDLSALAKTDSADRLPQATTSDEAGLPKEATIPGP